ncbi:hypothetical protein K1719_044185 [Acacia pycnantha]|nr:hypothetical protein K1719_044185 [Acacia pycnantha]
MEDPLLPYVSPRKKPPPPLPPLCPLPEHEEVVVPLTPSAIKDLLIFGPSSPTGSTPLIEALTLTLNSPKPSSSSEDPQDTQPQQSWLTDPNYPSHKTNLHRSKTAPALSVIKGVHHQSPVARPQFGSQSIVRQAVIFLILYLSLGVVIYWLNRHHFSATETHPVVDALYFCVVTMCTIGYGDITPNSIATKLFSILFVLVGFGFIDILLSGMVSYVLDLQENHLLQAVKTKVEIEKDARSYIIDVKKGE